MLQVSKEQHLQTDFLGLLNRIPLFKLENFEEETQK